jgi:hypothetical protein
MYFEGMNEHHHGEEKQAGKCDHCGEDCACSREEARTCGESCINAHRFCRPGFCLLKVVLATVVILGVFVVGYALGVNERNEWRYRDEKGYPMGWGCPMLRTYNAGYYPY